MEEGEPLAEVRVGQADLSEDAPRHEVDLAQLRLAVQSGALEERPVIDREAPR